jgi:hypothetical protein
MPNELNNIYDLAQQHCLTGCFPRQPRSATLRTRIESHLPSFCTNRGGASDATTLCLVFDSGRAPRFSLFSCRIGCSARHRKNPFSCYVFNCEQRYGCFGVTLLLTWRVGALFPSVRPIRVRQCEACSVYFRPTEVALPPHTLQVL